MFQTLKLHQLHGRDGLGRERVGLEWEEQRCQMHPRSLSPQFANMALGTMGGSQSQPAESTSSVLSSGRGDAFEHLKSTDAELRRCLGTLCSRTAPVPPS